MENSWLSKFLPKDEYKEKRILYFIAESSIILATMLFIFVLLNNYSLYGNSNTGTVALLSLGFIVAYILLRYILSGIEYTEVTTEKRYIKEKKAIINRSFIFLIILIIAYALIDGIPSNFTEIFPLFSSAFFIAVFMYFVSYTSLKRSFKKNKDILDD
ncbi:DUF3278 domain-containing protein (plasmid) [Pseudalkalibacillus hwajinpoensis]|uniref:DUF3278 domain-containing protein n=1 Tax=Guptibacillus hwajinpoensis TaxID=208199 RepID=UPI00325B315F